MATLKTHEVPPSFDGKLVLSLLFCLLAAGCLGHRDPRLQPDDLATRGQSHGHGGSNEAFLPQLRVPAPDAAFLAVPSPPASAHRAVLHSGPRGAPRLLQYPHDAAERTGTGSRSTAVPSLPMFSSFVSRIQHPHDFISTSMIKFASCHDAHPFKSKNSNVHADICEVKPLFSPQGFKGHWGTRGLFGYRE